LENPPKGIALWKLKALPAKPKALPVKPKAVLDADAFIQKWDYNGPRPLMGAGQSPAGFQGQRPWVVVSA
jgi:hypothetical protein